MKRFAAISIIASILFAVFAAPDSGAAPKKKFRYENGSWIEIIEESEEPATIESEVLSISPIAEIDTAAWTILPADTTLYVDDIMFPAHFYAPAIFDGYQLGIFPDSIANQPLPPDPNSLSYWADARLQAINRFRRFKQHYMISHPELVRYNINTLPEAPKQFRAFVDPNSANASITVEEVKVAKEDVRKEIDPLKVNRKNWLQSFNGEVHFTQTYVSPNWYQGGNNNLNVLINAVYRINLNQKFHPNVMFENVVEYRLGLNSAPDDSLRNYSISEDRFHLNSRFGLRAIKRWYYSASLDFRTQLLNNYRKNTTELQSAFLAPADLNFGIGMTYEYKSPKQVFRNDPKERFSAKLSIDPLSYNLKICTDTRLNETNFGIKQGHKSVSQYGSKLEASLNWRLCYNISYYSRLYTFTNYDYIQGDWEHKLSFNINKYLSTNLYVIFRYDSQMSPDPDSKWRKLQIKEMLSFGFTYNISAA